MNPPIFSTALEILLIDTFNIYRRGLRRQLHPSQLLPERDFNALIFMGCMGWLPLADRLILRKLSVACDQGLAAARRDQLEDSLEHYRQAEELLEVLKDSPSFAWQLGLSTYESGIAYLDYRLGHIERSRERLSAAMDADCFLETAGLPVMQVHRIQQGHNLVRMDFRLNRRDRAVQLAGMLLAYLEGRLRELPYHSNWRPRSLLAVPRGLLQSMLHQIIGETAMLIVAGEFSEAEWRLIIEASLLPPNPEASIFPQVQYALQARRAWLEGDDEGYLTTLQRFFGLGIRHCPHLWYAMSVELIDFCREIDLPLAGQVQGLLRQDSLKWKGLPSLLRERLDRAGIQAYAA